MKVYWIFIFYSSIVFIILNFILVKNAPPVTCSKLDTSLSYTPTEILTIFLDDLECFRGHILHICEEIKYAKSMAKG